MDAIYIISLFLFMRFMSNIHEFSEIYGETHGVAQDFIIAEYSAEQSLLANSFLDEVNYADI